MNHIVIDLEMNKIERQYRDSHKLSSELIEIGAVKMNENFDVIDTYQTYVSPEFGKMDALIIELTGITDDKLAGAPGFSEAMDDFAKWIGKKPAQFYSWSMCDIRQFQNEAEFKEYKGKIIHRMEVNWNDFQEEYSRLLGIEKKIKLKQAVASADYEFTGAQHTALADAVNTAEILRLSKNKEEFERVMKPVLDLFRTETSDNTLLNMCPEFFAAFSELSVSQTEPEHNDGSTNDDEASDKTKNIGDFSKKKKTKNP
ncbi:MAG: 3'-5' exonuclease [Butyribacter sp.]|nr:exonuclease domain-containing protein [bacterium]MDY3854711.1 3'-5' exonuclease [Butyribacter sp.]